MSRDAELAREALNNPLLADIFTVKLEEKRAALFRDSVSDEDALKMRREILAWLEFWRELNWILSSKR